MPKVNNDTNQSPDTINQGDTPKPDEQNPPLEVPGQNETPIPTPTRSKLNLI